MGFNIRSVSSSLIHTDIRGSVSIINSSDLSCIIDLARRAVVSEDALIEANKRIKELENELSKIRGSDVIVNEDTNEDTNEEDDNGFEDGKKRYRETGCINKVKIISLAVRGTKPSDIIDMVLKSESLKRKYSKAYISSVYSPKNINELDSLVNMCIEYSEYLNGVSIDAVKAFLYSRYSRKINRRSK